MEKYHHDKDGGEYGYVIEPDSEERVNRELYSAAERLGAYWRQYRGRTVGIADGSWSIKQTARASVCWTNNARLSRARIYDYTITNSSSLAPY